MLRGISAICAVTALLFVSHGSVAQTNTNTNKFKQLGQDLPTPNVYRTASGAPGHEYYQQQADYDMEIEIDDEKQVLSGVETITYRNNSPDKLVAERNVFLHEKIVEM